MTGLPIFTFLDRFSLCFAFADAVLVLQPASAGGRLCQPWCQRLAHQPASACCLSFRYEKVTKFTAAPLFCFLDSEQIMEHWKRADRKSVGEA